MMRKRSKKTSSPRWLRKQEEQKRKFFVFPLRFLFLLLLVFLLGWLGLKIFGHLRGSLWDGRHNFNFVVLSDSQLLVFSYRPPQNKVNILHLPGQTYVSLAKGFGEYPASSIWSLGQLEEVGGGDLLALSSQHFLGVPIQGWGRIKKLKIKTFVPSTGRGNEKLKISKKDLLELVVKLAFSQEKNLTWWDLTRLVYKFLGLPAAQIDFYSLEETRAGEEVILPDGSRGFRVQKEFLDKLSRDIFRDAVFLEEGITWVVANSTNHPDLAKEAARIIDNIGGGVIVTSDESQKGRKGGIYCWEKEICQSYSARLLSKTFRLKIREKKLEESRAEAVVVLDDSYWQFFYKR